MANDLNQCNFIGRLGRDPEMRTFPSGDEIATFSLAVGQTWKDKATGERKERTDWINVVASGALARVCADYLHKGSQVMVSGSMHNRKWTDKNGAERYSTEIRVNTLQMLGAREGQQETRAPTSQRSAPGARRVAAPSSGGSGFDDMDDDIPF